MRDISDKIPTSRQATAQALIRLTDKTIEKIKKGEIPKGNPLEVGKIAGIQAAKNTWQMIPYCHQLPLDFAGVEFNLLDNAIEIEATVKTINKTGVEMEAMTAASIAALTIYDMVKFLDDHAEVEFVKLLSKTGGKSDFKSTSSKQIKAAIIVMSDRVYNKKAEDRSGKVIKEALDANHIETRKLVVLPDNEKQLITTIVRLCDGQSIDLILITGGTGIGPRDKTPEAVNEVIDVPLPGVAEAIRAYGQERNPYAMLSRSIAGVRKNTVIVGMPGSTSGVKDALAVLLPHIIHSIDVLEGKGHEEKEKSLQSSGVTSS